MMFDVTLRVGEPVVQVIQGDDGDAYELHLVAPVLTLLPVGPGQFAPIQIGILKLPFDKPTTKNLIDSLTEGHELLKEHSNIAVAGDMSQASQLAEQLKATEGLRGPRS